MNWSPIKASAIRLKPGADLKAELIKLANDQRLQAASILTAVGSLSTVKLRLANQRTETLFDGKHEIVGLAGTFSQAGIHLHLCVSNSDGETIGGHLVEGSIVYTTAEIVIGELSSLSFAREHCTESGFHELVVRTRVQ